MYPPSTRKKVGTAPIAVEVAIDDICLTCCALHNMLLNIDDLDVKWNEGVKSPYEGEMGWHKNGIVEQHIPLIFV